MVAPLTALFLLLSGVPAGAALTSESDTEPGYWDGHAVIVAKVSGIMMDVGVRPARGPGRPPIVPEPMKGLHANVLTVLTAQAPVPREMDLLIGSLGDSALRPPNVDDYVAVICIERTPTGWAIDRMVLPFMPTRNGLCQVNDARDPVIEQLQKTLQESQSKSQLARLAEAQRAAEQRFAKQVGDYEDFWKIHALVLVHMVPVGVAKGVQADLKAVLFAPYVSPPLQGAVAFDWRTPALEKGGTQGEWAVLLLANSEIGWMVGSRSQPFMPDETGVVELNDEKDARIEQIQKGAAGWFQQILEGKTLVPVTLGGAGAVPSATAAPGDQR